MQKTIKELADELGVSKQAIQKRINNLPTNQQPTKVGGKYLLDENATDLIRSYYDPNKEEYKENANAKQQVVDNVLLEVVDSLKADKIELFDAMKAKDIQIEKLQKLLDQQQVLTLQANKKIAELELTVNEEEEKKGEKETPEEVKQETNEGKPKSFFSRLFGR